MNINSVINKSVDLKNVEKIIYRTFFIIIFSLPLIPEITHFGIYSLKYMLFNFFTIATLLVFLFISFLKIYDRNNQKSILDSLKKSDIKLNLLDIFIFTYFILVIFSSVLTKFGFINTFLGNNGRGEGVLTIFCYIATFYLFKNGVKYIGNMWKFAIFNVIIVSLYSIIQANFPQGFGEPFSPVHLTNVATGTMKNQNFLSSYVCIFLPTFMYIFIVSKKKLILIPTAMLFSTLIFSKTLGGYLTVICMFFIIVLSTLIFYKPRKITLIKILILTATCISVFLLISLIKSTSYAEELMDSKQEIEKLANKDDSFGTLRLAIWKKSIMIISNNPLFGVGPDSMANELASNSYLTDGKNDILNKYILDKSHCEFLHIAVTTGLPSLIAYLSFILYICFKLFLLVFNKHISCIKNKLSISNDTIFITAIFIGIISYLMQSTINISVIQVAPVFWAFLGIGTSFIDKKNTL